MGKDNMNKDQAQKPGFGQQGGKPAQGGQGGAGVNQQRPGTINNQPGGKNSQLGGGQGGQKKDDQWKDK
jgi:hypothetical protein